MTESWQLLIVDVCGFTIVWLFYASSGIGLAVVWWYNLVACTVKGSDARELCLHVRQIAGQFVNCTGKRLVFQALPIYIRRRNRRDGFDSVAAIHCQGVQCRRAARACPDKIYVSIQITDIVIQAFLLFIVIIRCALPAEREDMRAKPAHSPQRTGQLV